MISLSKCGYCCDLCKAYSPNILKNDQRKELSEIAGRRIHQLCFLTVAFLGIPDMRPTTIYFINRFRASMVMVPNFKSILTKDRVNVDTLVQI